MTRLRSAWTRWVAFLGEREGAESLAVARIIAGLTLLHHLISMWTSGVAGAMWVDVAHGGYRSLDEGWLSLFGGATPANVHALIAFTAAAALLLALGLFTRIAAILSWLGFVQLASLNWQCGGSSDELLTNALFLLMLSGCGETWSVDARRRGTPPAEIPAWPRRVLVFQLVLLYFTTALQKVSASWIPFGEMDALWYILQQPTWQKHDMRWLAPFFPLTQLATLVTWLFEMGAPLLLLVMWFRRSPVNRPGRLRRAFDRVHFRTSYLALGLALHVGIWATLEVGPFLGGILTLYAACFHPAEWRALVTRLRGFMTRPAPAT